MDLGKDSGIIQVRYYWYGEQDDTLVEQEDATANGIDRGACRADRIVRPSPTLWRPVNGPKDGIGPMRLLAVAEISRGRLGTRAVFDEILVNVEPAASLTTIDFETDKPLHLGRAGQSSAFGHVDSMGKIFELPVVGEFSDGVTRRISTPASDTSYKSSNDKVIKVLKDGLLQIVGNGKTVLTVTNRGKQAQLDIDVNVNDEPNEPPVADAGIEQNSESRVESEIERIEEPRCRRRSALLCMEPGTRQQNRAAGRG